MTIVFDRPFRDSFERVEGIPLKDRQRKYQVVTSSTLEQKIISWYNEKKIAVAFSTVVK